MLRRSRSPLTLWAFSLPLLFLAARRRTGSTRALAVCGLTFLLLTNLGCGARTVSTAAQASQSFSLTVTATSTNLAGSLVTHTVPLILTVQ